MNLNAINLPHYYFIHLTLKLQPQILSFHIYRSLTYRFRILCSRYFPTDKSFPNSLQCHFSLRHFDLLQELANKECEADYKSWFAERKTFRRDLDNMGLNEKYLMAKPDLSSQEMRVLKRLLDEKYPPPLTPPVSSVSSVVC